MTNQPIFILGAPRSGTTFLASLLEHTRYGAPFETQFITKYYKRLQQYGDIHNFNNFKHLVQDILSERAVQQWQLKVDTQAFYDDLPDDFTYSHIVNWLCLKRNVTHELLLWGDKTPHYLGDFDIIYKLFPEAHYIFIVRDGRDVCLSLLEKSWGPNNIYTCALYWKHLHQHMSQIRELEKSGQLYFLKYEDLLDNTKEYILDIYSFLGEECSEDVITRLAVTVKKGNYGKWKSRFSKRQLKTFEYTAATTLNYFGYETQYNERKLPVTYKLFYTLHEKLKRIIFLFQINVIDGIKIRFFGKEPFAE